MSDIKNPFAEYLPEAAEPQKPETPVTMEDVTTKALDLVRTVSWANESPDGAPTYVQNRLVFAQATTAIGEVANLDDADSVRRCIGTYFEICKLNSTDPSLPGLANALGISAKRLRNLNDTGTAGFFTQRPLQPDVKDAIDQAMRVLEQFFAGAVADGRISPAAATMLGQNHFGYVSKMNHAVDHTHRVDVPKTLADIQAEFDTLPPLEVEFEEVE